jgi:hypothetical protein
MSYIVYGELLCLYSDFSVVDNCIVLATHNPKAENLGFVKDSSSGDVRTVYRKKVKPDKVSEDFFINIQATYCNLLFRANVNIYGDLYIMADSSCRKIVNRKKEEDAIYLPLGFELNPDREEYGKKVSFEDCSEIYEVRKDYKFIPEYFSPGFTTELTGGYTVTDYDLDNSPFITSRRTIYRDGKKVAEFTKDLW